LYCDKVSSSILKLTEVSPEDVMFVLQDANCEVQPQPLRSGRGYRVGSDKVSSAHAW
jgi:hypothetical protein